jgi:predicted  nucleic acid-binding Zn-ribbon protein
MSSATLEATAGLFSRYESEIQALDQRKRAAEQRLAALQQTESELQARIAELLASLKDSEARIDAAQAKALQIVADAQRDGHAVRLAAQKDSEALHKKGNGAIEAARRAFEELN